MIGSGSIRDSDIWQGLSLGRGPAERLACVVGMIFFFNAFCLGWQKGDASEPGRVEVFEGEELPAIAS